MADYYPEDPVGDVGGGFTPINGVKEEENIVEPAIAEIKVEVTEEANENVNIQST